MSSKSKIVLKRISALVLCSMLLMNTIIGNGKPYVLAAEETAQENITQETTSGAGEEAVQDATKDAAVETTQEVTETVPEEATQDATQKVEESTQEVTKAVEQKTEQEAVVEDTTSETAGGATQEVTQDKEDKTLGTEEKTSDDDDDSKNVKMIVSVATSDNGSTCINDNQSKVDIKNKEAAIVKMIPNEGYYVSAVSGYDMSDVNVSVSADGTYTFEIVNNLVKEKEDDPKEVSIDITVTYSQIEDKTLSSNNNSSDYFSFSYDETTQKTTIVGANGWEAVGIVLVDNNKIFDYLEQIQVDGDISNMNFTKMYLVKNKSKFSNNSEEFVALTMDSQLKNPSLTVSSVTSNKQTLAKVNDLYTSNDAIQVNVETNENQFGNKVVAVYYDNKIEDGIDAQSVEVKNNTASIVFPSESLSATYRIWAVDEKKNVTNEEEITICIDKNADDIDTIFATNGISEWNNVQSDSKITSNKDLELNIDVNQNGNSPTSVKYSTVPEDKRKAKNISSADVISNNKFKISIDVKNNSNLEKVYYIWTYDAAGNKSEEKKINVLIDTNAPKLDVIVKNNNRTWTNPSSVITNEGITAFLNVNELGDATSGIKTVEYGASKDNMTTITQSADGKYYFVLGNNTDNINQKYFIKVTDTAENYTTTEIDFKIDKVAPTVKIKNSSEVSKLTNKAVEVNVEATDDMTGISKVWGVYIDENKQLKMVEATNKDGNKYNIIIDINKDTDLDSILYIFAKDNAGNIYANEEMNKVSPDAQAAIHMDKKAPTIVSTKNLSANTLGWSSGEVIIEVVVFDKNDIRKMTYSDKNKNVVELLSKKGVKNKDDSYTFTFKTTASEYDGKYNITATDEAGNTNSDKPEDVIVKIDTQTPQFQDCIISTLNTSTTAKIFNKLTFGLFFKEAIEVDVRVTDGIISSGIAGVTLYDKGQVKETKQPVISDDPEHLGEDGWVKFEINENSADMDLSLSVTDNVGHKCDSTPKEINDSLLSNVVVIDKEASSIGIEPEGGAYVDADEKKWFGNNANINVKAFDGLAGINAVAITINGLSITSDINGKAIGNNYQGKETRTLEDNFQVNTSQAEISQDGSYLIEVTVTDNADNIATQSLTIYKDTTSPYIKNFEFKGNGNNEGDGKASINGYYGYYYKGGASVTVTAADKEPSSGINAITYYTVNYADDANGVTSSEVTAAVNDKDQITFELPENFKGNVYAKATDHVNNVEASFENPNGVISENAKHHNGNSAVVISLPDSDSKDKNDNPLYKNNINVDVQLTDIYMGIASVEWSVISDYDTGNNQSGQIVIDNKKNLSGDIANWEKTSTDKNLVTSLSNTLTIQNDSNDIKILFKLTDRAGYTTEKEVIVSIDKQSPVIEVTYNNENFDQDFASETEYFKEARTATIVVSERNFDESKIETTITNADGNVPQISAWTESINADEPDKSTYTATIDYSQDGDYTFDITAADKAGNESADYTEDKFTIDLKIPVIKIDFNNNTPTNGFYYKEKRTATITIEEHNFETTRIEITGTATDGTTQLEYPKAGSWTDNGDMHTATIEYVGDALYTLNVAYKDKAGNEAEPVDADEFYVDENVPEIVFEGVENSTAYNDVVTPIVTCTDKNINKDTVKVSVKVVRAADTVVSDGSTTGIIEDLPEGCRLVMNDFEHTEDSDGIYTLDATVEDKAGNVTTQNITFSVNRFGSVYTLSNEMIETNGKYVKKPIDVVITETNADSIDVNNIQIKLTKNGVPSDLLAGQDYSVTESGGDNSWNQYKYTIDSGLFSGDGIYIVSINSTDQAGNVNDNNNETKKAEVWFGVDSTEPVVIPLNIEDDASYNQTEKQASISVEDNLLLNNVKIYLNGEEQNFSEENGNYTFAIADSTKSQKVEVVATDAAGNENRRIIKDFFVTTNVIVRMVHNKAVVATCATATAATTVGGVTLIRRRKLKLLKNVKKVITK